MNEGLRREYTATAVVPRRLSLVSPVPLVPLVPSPTPVVIGRWSSPGNSERERKRTDIIREEGEFDERESRREKKQGEKERE
jgi:hypothetical protein